MPFDSIAFVAAETPAAQRALRTLRKRYGDVAPEEADVIVTLGGDGTMLETLHRYMDRDVPFYGMNRGTVGFLLNEFRETGLKRRLEKASRVRLHPLRMRTWPDCAWRKVQSANSTAATVSRMRIDHASTPPKASGPNMSRPNTP